MVGFMTMWMAVSCMRWEVNWLASSQTVAPWSGYLGTLKQERGTGTWETWPHLTQFHSVARGEAAGTGSMRSRVGRVGREAWGRC